MHFSKFYHQKRQKCCRFLFLEIIKDLVNRMSDNLKIQIYCFKYLLSGLNASPFLLGATIKEHMDKFKDQYSETFDILDTHLYVNNLVNDTENIEGALKISQ